MRSFLIILFCIPFAAKSDYVSDCKKEFNYEENHKACEVIKNDFSLKCTRKLFMLNRHPAEIMSCAKINNNFSLECIDVLASGTYSTMIDSCSRIGNTFALACVKLLTAKTTHELEIENCALVNNDVSLNCVKDFGIKLTYSKIKQCSQLNLNTPKKLEQETNIDDSKRNPKPRDFSSSDDSSFSNGKAVPK